MTEPLETPPPAPLSAPSSAASHVGHAPQGKLAALSLAALGIVFGDIGTSP